MNAVNDAARVRIFGRSSSHFTRVVTIFAHELGVPFELVVVHDLTGLDVATYGGHPALRIPTLKVGTSLVFGTENICRQLTELAGRAGDPRVVFPEHVVADEARCAQELVWLAMSAQVELVMATVFAGLPADNVLLVKKAAGLQGALAWLEEHLEDVLERLPPSRDVSIFEVSLFCLVEHLAFRATGLVPPVAPASALGRFASSFTIRASAQQTAFRRDVVSGSVG